MRRSSGSFEKIDVSVEDVGFSLHQDDLHRS